MPPSDPSPPPHVSTIPVICDKCRAEGLAGDAAFTAIPDILAFDPVPLRAHVNNWTPEHQRAFIAALAITGSPLRAARALGRHAFGAESLRKKAGARSFNEAWDAALSIAREREIHRVHANLANLSAETEALRLPGEPLSAGAPGPRKAPMQPEDSPYIREIYGDHYNPEDYLDGHVEMVDAMGRIRDKMLRARRWLLSQLADDEDPARRAAWEVLAGPVDWDKAREMEPQDNEPAQGSRCGFPRLPNMLQPDMQLCHEAGVLGEFTGIGVNFDAEILRELEAERARDKPKSGDD